MNRMKNSKTQNYQKDGLKASQSFKKANSVKCCTAIKWSVIGRKTQLALENNS